MCLKLIHQHSFTCNNTVLRICSCLHRFKGNSFPCFSRFPDTQPHFSSSFQSTKFKYFITLHVQEIIVYRYGYGSCNHKLLQTKFTDFITLHHMEMFPNCQRHNPPQRKFYLREPQNIPPK